MGTPVEEVEGTQAGGQGTQHHTAKEATVGNKKRFITGDEGPVRVAQEETNLEPDERKENKMKASKGRGR